MKKVSFGFLCSQDPMEMPSVNHGQARYCAQCAKNIVDFTGMPPAEIARYLKTAIKPCGFMLPWQLNELNEHLETQRKNFISSRFNRLVKMAAVLSAPLVAGQAHAQICPQTNITETTPQTVAVHTEILLNARDGSPLRGVKLSLTNSLNEQLALLTTDDLGKIYLNKDLVAHGTITLRNTVLGIVRTFTLNQEPACMVWTTRLNAQVTSPAAEGYAFNFVLKKNGKSKRLSSAEVDITLYDSTNRLLRKVNCRTDKKGRLRITDGQLNGAAYLLFSFHGQNGTRTAYATLRHMDQQKTNELVVEDHDTFLMGLMME